MLYAMPFLLFWLAAGLTAGDMIIECALDTLEKSSFADNPAAMLLLFTLAAVIAMPWLIWRAIDEGIHSVFRR